MNDLGFWIKVIPDGKPGQSDHPKPESLTTKQIMGYTFKGCD